MYDLVSYDEKQNGCGPLAPDCCQPITPYCNNDGEDNNHSHDWGQDTWYEDRACGAKEECLFGFTPSGATTPPIKQCNHLDPWNWPGMVPPTSVQACQDWFCGTADNGPNQACIQNTIGQHKANGETTKRQLMRNFFTAMMVSRGTPMLLGGDEWMRTQLGNNNAYTTRADNPYSWFDWGTWQSSDFAWRMQSFVQGMIQFRKDHAYALAPLSYDGAPELDWLSPSGGSPNWGSRSLMVHYPPVAGPEFYVLVNMELTSTQFTLPPGNWALLVSTDPQYETVGSPIPGSDAAHVSGNVTLTSPALPSDLPQHTVGPKVIEVLEAI
jgi:hypothetical protein